MQLKVIIFSALVLFTTFLSLDNDRPNFNDYHKVMPCPETKETDIFLVHAYLLEYSKQQKKKSSLNISSNVQADEKKFEAFSKEKEKTPGLFRKYWEKKGVERVEKVTECDEIETSLRKSTKKNYEENEFRKVLYKVNDKFIVFFAPKNMQNTFYDKYPEPIIMNKNFKILKN